MSSTRKMRQGFLQQMMCRKVMTGEEARKILAGLAQELEGPADQSVKSVIKKLNDELRQCNLEIKGLNIAGEEVYGIVNTLADSVAKGQAAHLKDWEIAFFKDTIKALCDEKDGGVDRGDLLQMKVAHGGTFASIKDKETALYMWEAERWFRKDRHDRIFLGPRTFLELGDIVRSHGMEIPQLLYF